MKRELSKSSGNIRGVDPGKFLQSHLNGLPEACFRSEDYCRFEISMCNVLREYFRVSFSNRPSQRHRIESLLGVDMMNLQSEAQNLDLRSFSEIDSPVNEVLEDDPVCRYFDRFLSHSVGYLMPSFSLTCTPTFTYPLAHFICTYLSLLPTKDMVSLSFSLANLRRKANDNNPIFCDSLQCPDVLIFFFLVDCF